MMSMVAVVWLAVLAAAASFSPSALVATWLFIFWLMTMEIAWKPAENTGIRNRPISPQPSQVQNRHVGMPDSSMPRKEKFISRSFAPAKSATSFSSGMNSPSWPAAASWA